MRGFPRTRVEPAAPLPAHLLWACQQNRDRIPPVTLRADDGTPQRCSGPGVSVGSTGAAGTVLIEGAKSKQTIAPSLGEVELSFGIGEGSLP
jgi:hypothetical protein